MKGSIQRLRAEIRSDRDAWSLRVEELRELDSSRSEPGALAQAAVGLHHGYGAIESAQTPLQSDLDALDAHLAQVAREID